MKRIVYIVLFLAILAFTFNFGPELALGQSMSEANFTNPLKFDTIEGVLNSIMSYLKGIAGLIAVIFIIIGGLMYMFSAGDKGRMERGKNTLTYALIGFAIVVAAPTFLKEIKSILGGDITGMDGLSLQEIGLNVLSLLLSIVGLIAIISMIVGAILMFGATGDKDRFEAGKKTVTYSIVGIIIASAALILVEQVVSLLEG